MRIITVGLLTLMLAACQTTQTSRTDESVSSTTPTIEADEGSQSSARNAALGDTVRSNATASQEATPPVIAPQDAADLWVRISSQFELDIPLDEPHIQAQLKWLNKHPNYMAKVTERAEPYIHWIVSELERRQLPLELALLPIVESTYNPLAYSSGKAAGMWQITPVTATHLGLKSNWWYDGRLDVLASTDAALNYLTDLNKEFNGNWLHALAAYNWGGRRVKNAIKANIKKGKPTDFWSLNLPAETTSYVPKLFALSELIRNRSKYKLDFPPIPNQPYFQSVDIGGQFDLSLAADLAGINISQLKQLNPAFKQWATAPDGPNQLLVPVGQAKSFEVAVNDMAESDRMRWQRYKVVQGDTLSQIAKNYKTTTQSIREFNKLRSNMIRIGQALLIPSGKTTAAIQRSTAPQSKIEYLVKAGDNLWDISRDFNISHKQLAKWNGIATSDALQINQRLVILPEDTAKSSITYKVRSGDSLYEIAQKFKVRVADLIKWNRLEGERYLQPGQQLKLFV